MGNKQGEPQYDQHQKNIQAAIDIFDKLKVDKMSVEDVIMSLGMAFTMACFSAGLERQTVFKLVTKLERMLFEADGSSNAGQLDTNVLGEKDLSTVAGST